MGLKKSTIPSISESVPAISPLADSGLNAAVTRLQEKKAPAPVTKKYEGRDFDREARGKSKFGLYAAALQSPALAGAKWSSVEEFLKIVRQAADDGMTYVFDDK